MRSRHASTACATCSADRSDRLVTESGALTITSCAPDAGCAVNRSGFACGSGVAASGSSAGYLFGTTRTVQPGVSGPPPFGRTA
jgi:hypothetical protein